MPLLLPFDLSQKWLNEELPIEDYKAILHFEMPAEELNYLPVFSIRTSKLRPDSKAKNEYYEWENLPGIEIT